MHYLPFGQLPGTVFNRRHIPPLQGFFTGGLTPAIALLDPGSIGLFPFPGYAAWSLGSSFLLASCRGPWPTSFGCCPSHSDRSNGSLEGFGPGRQDTYSHESLHVHDRSSEAAISMRNWISYSGHANLYVTFWWSCKTE